MKKPADSVWFYKQTTEKTELNPNGIKQSQIGKKPSQTEPKPEKPSQTEKTEPNQKNRVKPSQNRKNRAKQKKPSQTRKTESNRFELVFVLKNQTESKPVGSNRFQFFFFLNFVLVIFFDKNRTERKIITPTIRSIF